MFNQPFPPNYGMFVDQNNMMPPNMQQVMFQQQQQQQQQQQNLNNAPISAPGTQDEEAMLTDEQKQEKGTQS